MSDDEFTTDEEFNFVRDTANVTIQGQVTWAILILTFLVAVVTMISVLQREYLWTVFAFVYEIFAFGISYSVSRYIHATWNMKQWWIKTWSYPKATKFGKNNKKLEQSASRAFYESWLFGKDNEKLNTGRLTVVQSVIFLVATLMFAARLTDLGITMWEVITTLVISLLVGIVIMAKIGSSEAVK